MSTAETYSKLGYLMMKKETTSGTPVYPNVAIELLNENLLPNWDMTVVSPIATSRSKNHRPAKNQVGPFEGTVEIYVEPNSIGYFLCGFFGEDSHTTFTAGVSEQSDFQPLTTLPSFTVDIKEAGKSYVTRYFGTHFKKITFSLEDNKLKASIDFFAQRVFTNARLTVAHASGTTLDLDQTSGLTTSDTLIILDDAAPDTSLAELTIVSVDSELTLTTSAIGASLGVSDIVMIKAQSIDPDNYVYTNELIWAGGANVEIGNGANGFQNLAAMTNCESMELTLENDLEARWSATGTDVVDRMPSAILVKGVAVSGKFSEFHANPKFIDILRQMEQTSLRFQFLGNVLAANSAVAATGVLESDGSGTVTVTVDTAGDAGNDWAIDVVQGTGALSATLSGKLITLTLSSTPSNNAVATVATAIAALSGVSATSASTGNVTVTDNPDKVQFAGGRDASERERVRFDLPDVRFLPFHPNLGNDDVVQEEIEFTAFRDVNDEREIKVRLLNQTTAY